MRYEQPASKELNIAQNSNVQNASISVNDEFAGGKQQYLQPTVEDFIDEINAYTKACGVNISKEELGVNLHKILQKYPSLANSSLQNVLSGVINNASENNCSIQWREEELYELWNG